MGFDGSRGLDLTNPWLRQEARADNSSQRA